MHSIFSTQTSNIQCHCGYSIALSAQTYNGVNSCQSITCNCGVIYTVNYFISVSEDHTIKLKEEIEMLREKLKACDPEVEDDTQHGDNYDE